jgi:hypothetical protein
MEKGKVILFRNKMQVIVKNNYQIAKKHLQVAIKDVWPKGIDAPPEGNSQGAT